MSSCFSGALFCQDWKPALMSMDLPFLFPNLPRFALLVEDDESNAAGGKKNGISREQS
jgi:hypothetical protein